MGVSLRGALRTSGPSAGAALTPGSARTSDIERFFAGAGRRAWLEGDAGRDTSATAALAVTAAGSPKAVDELPPPRLP